MIVVVMGVCGSGKTTVGERLAAALGCAFLEADLLHPAANVEKMTRGAPLADTDRAPWLAAVRERLREAARRGESLVAACSALGRAHRAFLAEGMAVTWVHLAGPEELVRQRLQRRAGHFMREEMLASQLAALEPPGDAIVVDVAAPPEAIVADILAQLPPAPVVHVLADLDAASLALAEALVRTIERVTRDAGRCSIALSGGDAPRPLHRLLATRFRDRIPWERVHLFWGDDRYVPHDDARSNYRMARETLLDHVPCPASNVHPMPTHFADPEDAARDYEATLRRYFSGGWPRFDLMLLGIGPDGHTASLFPRADALREDARWVVAVTADAEPPRRLTLTLPVLVRSAHVHFLVAGAGKAEAVARALSGSADPRELPAAAVRPLGGTLTWWLDRAAGAGHPAR